MSVTHYDSTGNMQRYAQNDCAVRLDAWPRISRTTTGLHFGGTVSFDFFKAPPVADLDGGVCLVGLSDPDHAPTALFAARLSARGTSVIAIFDQPVPCGLEQLVPDQLLATAFRLVPRGAAAAALLSAV